MKTFELLSIIGSIAAVGIALGAVVIGSNANLHAEMRTEMQNLRCGNAHGNAQSAHGRACRPHGHAQ